MFQGDMIPAAAGGRCAPPAPGWAAAATPRPLQPWLPCGAAAGTMRRQTAPPGRRDRLGLRPKGSLLQTACFPLPGAPSPGRQGKRSWRIAKGRHNVPALGDATANQEVISPLISVMCAVDVYSSIRIPTHSIASSGTNVKHKSKKAALCAAFLFYISCRAG